MKTISRREMIIKSGRFAFMSAVALNGFGCVSFSGRPDWLSLDHSNDGLGFARVVAVAGHGSFAGKSIKVGDKLDDSSDIETVDSASAVLSLPDGSVAKLKGRSRLTLNLDSRQGGELTLKQGALLSAIRPRRDRPIIIKGATAMVGVRGTVCFMEVFDNLSRSADRRIPDNASDYFCLCNGEVDFLDDPRVQPLSELKTSYHRASFSMVNNGESALVDAGFLLNHTDEEISDLVDQMAPPKLDLEWIRHQGASVKY